MEYYVYFPGESNPETWDTDRSPMPRFGRESTFSNRNGVFVVNAIDRNSSPPRVEFRKRWTRKDSINL
ncbi:hypothetical protein HN935_01685 [archaeon]|jgi:hypothetical protein|nr:hypothetical protein [archaeon]